MNTFALTVMMYHYIRDQGDAAGMGSGIAGLSVARFDAQLDDLARRYEMISWADLRDGLLGSDRGAALPSQACLLTFDDGVRDHYLNVFPALRACNLSGLFFALARTPGDGLALGHKIQLLLARLGPQDLRQAVWSRLTADRRQAFVRAEERYAASDHAGLVESAEVEVLKLVLQRELSRGAEGILGELTAKHVGPEAEVADEFYLTQHHVAEMAAEGMHCGGHSRNHPWFDWVGAEGQTQEIEASAAWLRRIEPGPWAFAYPYGGYSAESPALLQAHGFAAAFTTHPQATHADPFLIGRMDGELLM